MQRKQSAREPDARRQLAFEPLEPRELLAADTGLDWWSSWDTGPAGDWAWTFDDSWGADTGAEPSWDNAWWVGDTAGQTPTDAGFDAGGYEWSGSVGGDTASTAAEAAPTVDPVSPPVLPPPPVSPPVAAVPLPTPSTTPPPSEPENAAPRPDEIPTAEVTSPPLPVAGPSVAPAPDVTDSELPGMEPEREETGPPASAAVADLPETVPAAPTMDSQPEPASAPPATHDDPDGADATVTATANADDRIPGVEIPDATVLYTMFDDVVSADDFDDATDPLVGLADDAPVAEDCSGNDATPSLPDDPSPEFTAPGLPDAEDDLADGAVVATPPLPSVAEPVASTPSTPEVRSLTPAAGPTATPAASAPTARGTAFRAWGAFFFPVFGGPVGGADGQMAGAPTEGQPGTSRPRIRLPFRPVV